MFYDGGMDALIKLQEIAVHMGLEPAEEVGPGTAAPVVGRGGGERERGQGRKGERERG